ncbi:MAG: LacI family DNA-binding transcriptional regulator [Planctomycetota bacterium]
MPSAKLSQVAEAAGVSVSVASRALNGHAEKFRISEETTRRVRRAAESLKYRANHTARALRLSKSGLVGVVVPDLSNPFFASIARSVSLVVESEGYSVVLADSREETDREVEVLKKLSAREVEGYVVCPVGRQSDHLVEIKQSGTPVVLADRTFPDSDLIQVTSKHRLGARWITELLLAQGHRSIGILQGLPGTLPNTQRLLGVQDAVKGDNDAKGDVLWTVAGNNFSQQSGCESTRELLAIQPSITALFAFSTPNAMGAMRVAAESGRSVPNDLSMVTFDDSPYSDLMAVPLTTVDQDVGRIGTTAASLLLDALSGARKKRKHVQEVPVKLLKRHSIAKAKTR